ncbi:MAG TPA: TlpA disulfide reductase family protein [Microbacteriaceae bacterium]|nr:TlpA disulfide reductase family protein [Microbacteriaceae bacterium]
MTGALVALAAMSLAGCSANDDLARQYAEGSNKGYIAGDGTILEIPAANRSTPVTFGGMTTDGTEFSSSDWLGKVLVVNFWYAGCAPCRAEAPLLEEVASGFDSDRAGIVGVNVRDQSSTAQAFNTKFGVSFPSVLDAESGAVQLAFSGTVPANAVPTTIVLDSKGRVAARILGRVAEASILATIVRDLEAEPRD